MMFSASESRLVARQALRGQWGLPILVCVVSWLLSGGIMTLYYSVAEEIATRQQYYGSAYDSVTAALPYAGWTWLVSLACLLVSGAISLGVCLFFVQLLLGQAPCFKTMFSRFSFFWKALGLQLFCGLFIWLWSLLLVVPGIIAAYRYSQAYYLMAENPNLGIREAVNLSKQMMQGNKGRLFCLDLSFIGWAILSGLSFGIGLFWLAPYMNVAHTAFYLNLQNRVQLN